MTIRNVSDAKKQLSALLAEVENGGEVIIARAGKPVARLIKFEQPKGLRDLGVLKGRFKVGPDFDRPDPEVESLLHKGAIDPIS